MEAIEALGEELPGEAVFKAMVADVQEGAKTKTIRRLGRRLNFERAGMSSLFRKTARKVRRLKEPDSYKAVLLEVDKRWRDMNTWRLIKREGGIFTQSHFFSAIDRQINEGSDTLSQAGKINLIECFKRRGQFIRKHIA